MVYKYNAPKTYGIGTVRADIALEFKRWNEQAGTPVIGAWALENVRAGTIEAALEFTLRGGARRIRVDRWDTYAVNLQCVYLILRDMRLAEARGLTEAIMEAYGLLTAGPAPKRDPWIVLELPVGTASPVLKAQYKELAKKRHPDVKGGSAEAFKELQQAYEQLTGEAPE